MNGNVKVGIVGYGNLGKAVEQLLSIGPDSEIVAIFSKRNVVSPLGTKVEKYGKIADYAGKIDIMLLCGGSYAEQENMTKELLQYYNTIDCFDTHAKMQDYSLAINQIAKENKKIALFGCGWDPGLFSVMRCLFDSVSQDQSHTFWGKGVSQGHTNALKQVDGVIDALQFTLPNKNILKKCKKDCCYAPKNVKDKHSRLCYIVKDKNSSAKAITKAICEMPNYFEGYKTKVKFVSQTRLDKLKGDVSHRGQVFNHFSMLGKNFQMEFRLDLEGNALFTAQIMHTCINAFFALKQNKKYGAYSMLDIPPKYYYSQQDAVIKLL